MRRQKIRGHRRLQRQIEKWRLENLDLRLDLIHKYKSDHIDIVVHPYCDISIIKSTFPPPHGKTKRLILGGLLDIYESWETEIKKLGVPYYLKLWIFEPRFSKSQVVCAIENRIDFYENNFYRPDKDKTIRLENYGALKPRLEKLRWDFHHDERELDNDTVGKPEQYASYKDFEEDERWFNKLMKKPHRTVKHTDSNGTTESYHFRHGDMWIGGKK